MKGKFCYQKRWCLKTIAVMSAIFNKNSRKPGGFCVAYEFKELSYFFESTFTQTIRILFLINWPQRSTGAPRVEHSFTWLPCPSQERGEISWTFWVFREDFYVLPTFFFLIFSLFLCLYPHSPLRDRNLNWGASSFHLFLCLVLELERISNASQLGSYGDRLKHLTLPTTTQTKINIGFFSKFTKLKRWNSYLRCKSLPSYLRDGIHLLNLE